MGKEKEKKDKDKGKEKEKEKEKDKGKEKEKDKGKGKDKDKEKTKNKDKKKMDKELKREKVKKMSKEEKRELRTKKKEKKKGKKSDVVIKSMRGYEESDLQIKVKDATTQAREGKLGFGAKSAAEEWATAGKTEGLQIWRVEKFTIQSWPQDQYGKFYNGDSFIVLRTYKSGNALRWDVHFWLGENTTQDEAGTAAYKTVELDTQLGGLAVQHREVQDYESPLFLSYFKPMIQILRGGIESGFTHVESPEKTHRKRLLHLKGKKNIRTTEVSCNSDSLNSGDVFLLDNYSALYLWYGKQSGIFERRKGGELATALKNERGGKPTIATLDEGKEEKVFWDLMGGPGPIMSAEEGGEDIEAEQEQQQVKKLIRLSDATGALKLTEVANGTVKKSALDSKDVFIFDTGFEIFCWIGKQSSAQEKTKAMSYASSYLQQSNKPPFLPVTRILEGGENPTFSALFS